MKKLLALIVVVVSLFACGNEKLPEGILSEDKIVEVMIDIHLTEGLVSTFPIHYDSSRVLYPMFEKEVLKKHQLTDSVLVKSLEYYMKDARIMDKIYARTIDSLHVIEKEGNNSQ